jgi:hypothetical protein
VNQSGQYTFQPGAVPTGISEPPSYFAIPPASRTPGFRTPSPVAAGVPDAYAAAGYVPSYSLGSTAGTDAFAIAAFVLSVVGLGLGGVVFGHLALHRISLSGRHGHGLAVAGLVLGYLGLVLGLAYAGIRFAVLPGFAIPVF